MSTENKNIMFNLALDIEKAFKVRAASNSKLKYCLKSVSDIVLCVSPIFFFFFFFFVNFIITDMIIAY